MNYKILTCTLAFCVIVSLIGLAVSLTVRPTHEAPDRNVDVALLRIFGDEAIDDELIGASREETPDEETATRSVFIGPDGTVGGISSGSYRSRRSAAGNNYGVNTQLHAKEVNAGLLSNLFGHSQLQYYDVKAVSELPSHAFTDHPQQHAMLHEAVHHMLINHGTAGSRSQHYQDASRIVSAHAAETMKKHSDSSSASLTLGIILLADIIGLSLVGVTALAYRFYRSHTIKGQSKSIESDLKARGIVSTKITSDPAPGSTNEESRLRKKQEMVSLMRTGVGLLNPSGFPQAPTAPLEEGVTARSQAYPLLPARNESDTTLFRK